MASEDRQLLRETRRHFFDQCGVGVGQIALASLLWQAVRRRLNRRIRWLQSHRISPRIKNVIFLFMAGAPSQLELFDYKPKLNEHDGQVAPDSIMQGKRFAFMDTFTKEPPKLLGEQEGVQAVR